MNSVSEHEKLLAKAVLFACQALNIDMGDGEPTYQCCNSVCGHGSTSCLIGQARDLALQITGLSQKDLVQINKIRARAADSFSNNTMHQIKPIKRTRRK